MKQGELGSRLLVAAWGIPLILGLTWLGGWWTALLVGAAAAAAQFEYYRLMEAQGRKPFVVVGLIAGLVITALWWISGMEALGWTLAALLLIFELLALYTDRRHSDVLASFGGVCYPPLLGGAFLLLRNYDAGGDEGRWLAIGLWGALWICDTAAYAGGAAFGRHPLAPQISPKKTVEGLIAGVVGTAAFMTLWRLLGLIPTELAVAMVVAVGLIGQLGDLVESSIKREAGVKDSGTMLPGHGGALDRFDSLFAAAPALAMYLIIESYLRI